MDKEVVREWCKICCPGNMEFYVSTLYECTQEYLKASRIRLTWIVVLSNLITLTAYPFCMCTHIYRHIHSSSKGFAMLASTHGQPHLVWFTINCHITFNVYDCHKMTSKHQFQSRELKITGCKVCQIQWLWHEGNLFFHEKMLHCHSPETLWCSIYPVNNISGSFLLTLSCKHDSTST